MKNKNEFQKFQILIIIITLITLLAQSVISDTIGANSLEYVFSSKPDKLMIGSQLCLRDNIEKCAPIISFTVPQDSDSLISVELSSNVDISGRVCLLQETQYTTWDEIMSATFSCTNFATDNSTINFQKQLFSGLNKLVLIPDSGAGDADVSQAILIISEELGSDDIEVEPEVIIDPIKIISQGNISKCAIDNIYFESSELMMNMPINIKIKTTGCQNSVLRINILKKEFTDSIVSEQQALVSKDEISLLWIPEEVGEFYVRAISENTIESEHLKIAELNIASVLEKNRFYEVMSDVRDVSRSNTRTAIEICEAMPAQVERDACFEELAVYSQNKNICSEIVEPNRRVACKQVFVLYGDLGGCLEAENKATCALIGLIARDQDFEMFTTKTNDEQEDIVMKEKLKKTSSWYLIICLVIICLVVFLGIELWNKKLHQKKKVRKRKNKTKKNNK